MGSIHSGQKRKVERERRFQQLRAALQRMRIQASQRMAAARQRFSRGQQVRRLHSMNAMLSNMRARTVRSWQQDRYRQIAKPIPRPVVSVSLTRTMSAKLLARLHHSTPLVQRSRMTTSHARKGMTLRRNWESSRTAPSVSHHVASQWGNPRLASHELAVRWAR